MTPENPSPPAARNKGENQRKSQSQSQRVRKKERDKDKEGAPVCGLPWSADLAAAAEAARTAAAVTLEGWNGPLDIEHKGTVDLVTQYDRGAEDAAMAVVSRRCPDDLIVAEESGGNATLDPSAEDGEGQGLDPGQGQKQGRVWHIDPLDGTTNFAHGFPMFASSVGLLVDGVPQVGVISAPAVGWTFAAQRGRGATWNGRPMSVSTTQRLGDCLAVTGFPYSRRRHAQAIAQRVKTFLETAQGLRRVGAAALDLCFVACGWLDLYFETSLNTWDVAAGTLLVQEAGGVVTDWRGGGAQQAIPKGEVAASNGAVHAALLEILGPIIEREESEKSRKASTFGPCGPPKGFA